MQIKLYDYNQRCFQGGNPTTAIQFGQRLWPSLQQRNKSQILENISNCPPAECLDPYLSPSRISRPTIVIIMALLRRICAIVIQGPMLFLSAFQFPSLFQSKANLHVDLCFFMIFYFVVSSTTSTSLYTFILRIIIPLLQADIFFLLVFGSTLSLESLHLLQAQLLSLVFLVFFSFFLLLLLLLFFCSVSKSFSLQNLTLATLLLLLPLSSFPLYVRF